MNWKENLTAFGLLWLRALTGIGIATHGFGKIFGGRMEKFTEGIEKMGFPMPEFFAWSAAGSELLGGILLALGLATRPAAFLIFCTMSVAAFVRHGSDPFQAKELALAYWTMAGALMLTGAGRLSLDARLGRCKPKPQSS